MARGEERLEPGVLISGHYLGCYKEDTHISVRAGALELRVKK